MKVVLSIQTQFPRETKRNETIYRSRMAIISKVLQVSNSNEMPNITRLSGKMVKYGIQNCNGGNTINEYFLQTKCHGMHYHNKCSFAHIQFNSIKIILKLMRFYILFLPCSLASPPSQHLSSLHFEFIH